MQLEAYSIYYLGFSTCLVYKHSSNNVIEAMQLDSGTHEDHFLDYCSSEAEVPQSILLISPTFLLIHSNCKVEEDHYLEWPVASSCYFLLYLQLYY